ncbi:hypothetical protein MJO29_004657 [Puccinia striiformis f. sp. tritici]|uniref:Uncharacterized protein n=1 Tax=Puccinia striiformis TaxID=27350 RepID=A0A2S4VSF5_9BASI|nr:hypothetical protein MJO29_004657 [Puccinia striiformis f. sp. tritici]POW12310.1 hypothetical protein PSTT_04560 [Puccinia striiformis]
MPTNNSIVTCKQRMFYSALVIFSIGVDLGQALPSGLTIGDLIPNLRSNHYPLLKDGSNHYSLLKDEESTTREIRPSQQHGGCLLSCLALGGLSPSLVAPEGLAEKIHSPPLVAKDLATKKFTSRRMLPTKGTLIGGHRPEACKPKGSILGFRKKLTAEAPGSKENTKLAASPPKDIAKTEIKGGNEPMPAKAIPLQSDSRKETEEIPFNGEISFRASSGNEATRALSTEIPDQSSNAHDRGVQ